ncbi:MAG: PfkB family carbohydrate kinase [Candidatus Woesearchaeota archaeon]
MVDLVIAGSIGLDDIETPFGNAKKVLGGSGIYAAHAAAFFAKPGLVSITGTDFPDEHISLLTGKGIGLEGVERKGKTLRWEGFYEYDMNEAETRRTELNSLLDFNPKLPEKYRKAKYVFLGNLDPVVQIKVMDQLEDPELVVMDTMNFWIESKKEELLNAIKKVDILVLNDAEARELFEEVNLVKAADRVLDLGPKAVVIKKGEHGALLFMRENGERKHFSAPGYPLETIKDPTGCGDSFGGGMIGWLAKTGDTSEANLRKAVIYGSVLASFNAEDFSLERQKTLAMEEIDRRFHEFRGIREF